MSTPASKLRNERKRHARLRGAVRKFLSDFKHGGYSDWQESLGVLRMLTEKRAAARATDSREGT